MPLAVVVLGLLAMMSAAAPAVVAVVVMALNSLLAATLFSVARVVMALKVATATLALIFVVPMMFTVLLHRCHLLFSWNWIS